LRLVHGLIVAGGGLWLLIVIARVAVQATTKIFFLFVIGTRATIEGLGLFERGLIFILVRLPFEEAHAEVVILFRDRFLLDRQSLGGRLRIDRVLVKFLVVFEAIVLQIGKTPLGRRLNDVVGLFNDGLIGSRGILASTATTSPPLAATPIILLITGGIILSFGSGNFGRTRFVIDVARPNLPLPASLIPRRPIEISIVDIAPFVTAFSPRFSRRILGFRGSG
jgi:hypothetical protein